ncbi:MAG: DNA-protecting protein DprA [Chitinophagaceae bacterium]|nr:DNA-protecting protein DprA [Chitinophagaceae bacterium]
MSNELLYQIALTRVPQIGCIHARTLVDHFQTAEQIFKASIRDLERIEGIGTIRAKKIKGFAAFNDVEDEMLFINKYKIEPIFITSLNYPQRLLNCYDPPTILYYRGNANLNASRIVAIIGTRSLTDYGKQITEELVRELATEQAMIVSGLAFGVDGVAHKNCLKNNIATVGVLAHGLDTIYPAQHAGLAREMIKNNGGLLTEFGSNTKPDKHNFPSRNRIVAGMSDAVIVVESGIKGGSMVTAELANSYNRDVFAVPGKINDAKSAGCNYLIRNNKAILLAEVGQVAQTLGWTDVKKSLSRPKELFLHLNPDERLIVDLLNGMSHTSIDELNLKTGLSSSAVAAAILNLELQQVVKTLPGKMYCLY